MAIIAEDVRLLSKLSIACVRILLAALPHFPANLFLSKCCDIT